MKIYTSPAIIMRVKELGESDLLVTFFTPDRGRLKGVAKGACRSRKRFVNCLDIFSLVRLEYGLKRKGSLHFIQSGMLVDAFPGLRSDFATLSRASYMIELTEILFPWELPDPNIFEILKKSFHFMSEGEKAGLIPIIYEVMAMTCGGYGINLEKCCVCGRMYSGEGTAAYKTEKGGIACLKCQQVTALTPKMDPDSVRLLRQMQSRSLSIFDGLNPGDEAVSQVRTVLKLHREYHLGKRPKTADYL